MAKPLPAKGPPSKPSPRAEAIREVTERAAKRTTGRKGKPSTVGHAARGALAGGSTGATVGSIVPGVGTAAGAAVGTGVGTVAGAASGRRAKREWKAARRSDLGGMRRVLVAEFVICTIILALTPLASSTDKPVAPADWMKRGTALCGLFLILGLVSSASAQMAKVAASLGGLVTLVLAVDQRRLFGIIAERLQSTGSGTVPDDGPPPTPTTVEEAVAQTGYLSPVPAPSGAWVVAVPRPR